MIRLRSAISRAGSSTAGCATGRVLCGSWEWESRGSSSTGSWHWTRRSDRRGAVLLRRRRSRKELPQLAEEEVYARSYGERSDDVTNVVRRPAQEPEPVRAPRLSD